MYGQQLLLLLDIRRKSAVKTFDVHLFRTKRLLRGDHLSSMISFCHKRLSWQLLECELGSS